MAAAWDVVGTAPAQLQNPWAVRNIAPAPQPTTLEGVSDIAESGVENIPHAAAAAAIDLYRRLSGGDISAPEPPIVSALRMPMGSAGKALVNKITGAKLPGDEGSGDVNEAAGFGMDPTLKSLVGGTGAVAGDVGALAGAGAVAKNLVTGGADAAATSGPYGMRTGAENPVARNVAGSSARPATAAHNQAIADPALGAQAGVPPGTKLTPQTLETAREAPNSVYQRAEASIPPGPLSPAATQAVQGVGADDMIVHSPDTQATIDAQKARLLSGPLTGSQVVNAQRALRFNGFRNIGSEDPEQLALGQAQLKMSDALHQHMVDTLPPNAPVSADQLQAARTALAQNHTIENVLGPNGNVDLTKLAKIHNDNPGMLTGPMQDIAQFASDHPEVTRLPSDAERFNPSGVAKDVASIDLKRPISYVQPLFGALARRMLTGGAEVPRVPVTGAGGEFGPIDRTPQPPAGMTATPPTAPPPAAASPPGQIPLEDLLSHGVEQPPAAGLQSGPMSAPAPGGVPFQGAPEVVGTRVVKGGAPPFVSQGRFINDQHVEGPETPSSRLVPSTLDELLNGPPRSYGGQPTSMSDFADVKSQGVPDGTVTRSPASSAPDFEKLGQPLVSQAITRTGEHVFSSPNGSTTAIRLPDGSMKIIDSTTSRAARGTGEGSARIEAAAKAAHSDGVPLVSDNEVSAPEQKVYESLARRGFDVRENPNTVDKGTGVKKSTSELKGVYEIHPPESGLGQVFP